MAGFELCKSKRIWANVMSYHLSDVCLMGLLEFVRRMRCNIQIFALLSTRTMDSSWEAEVGGDDYIGCAVLSFGAFEK